jgi:hypothetical protein
LPTLEAWGERKELTGMLYEHLLSVAYQEVDFKYWTEHSYLPALAVKGKITVDHEAKVWKIDDHVIRVPADACHVEVKAFSLNKIQKCQTKTLREMRAWLEEALATRAISMSVLITWRSAGGKKKFFPSSVWMEEGWKGHRDTTAVEIHHPLGCGTVMDFLHIASDADPGPHTCELSFAQQEDEIVPVPIDDEDEDMPAPKKSRPLLYTVNFTKKAKQIVAANLFLDEDDEEEEEPPW